MKLLHLKKIGSKEVHSVVAHLPSTKYKKLQMLCLEIRETATTTFNTFTQWWGIDLNPLALLRRCFSKVQEYCFGLLWSSYVLARQKYLQIVHDDQLRE